MTAFEPCEMKKSTMRGFTLLEIIVTVAIIGIIAVALLVLINPWQQINKAHDAKRKHDLNILKNAFEQYYTDKGCYPRPEDVCFDAASAASVCSAGAPKIAQSSACHICGSEGTSPSFAPYLDELPCDPQHPQNDYLYEAELPGCLFNNGGCNSSRVACIAANGNNYCPKWYSTYAKLSNKKDAEIKGVGCQASGCGPAFPAPTESYGYDYGITTKTLNKTETFFCYNINDDCNACGTYEECENSNYCIDIYHSQSSCRQVHPGA